MSPFMQFTDGGRRFQCPFCTASTEGWILGAEIGSGVG